MRQRVKTQIKLKEKGLWSSLDVFTREFKLAAVKELNPG